MFDRIIRTLPLLALLGGVIMITSYIIQDHKKKTKERIRKEASVAVSVKTLPNGGNEEKKDHRLASRIFKSPELLDEKIADSTINNTATILTQKACVSKSTNTLIQHALTETDSSLKINPTVVIKTRAYFKELKDAREAQKKRIAFTPRSEPYKKRVNKLMNMRATRLKKGGE